MAHLRLIQDNRVARSFPLRDGEALLGRAEQCDIQLGFSGIRGHHLRLLTHSGDTLVQDLGSDTGTYINGRPAKQCVLRHGDVMRIGEVELRFEIDPANDEAIAAREPTGNHPADAPEMHFTAKAEQLRLETAVARSHQGNVWERFKLWLGL